MITAGDLVHLPYGPDLTEAGIAYACRALVHMHQGAGVSTYNRLRRTVAALAVDLAFRRYLTQQDVGFQVTAPAAFSDPDRYDVLLGGRRCRIQSSFISNPEQVAALLADPTLALETPALVPSEHYAADGQADDDMYLFALVLGSTGASAATVGTAQSQPRFLLHAMPPVWARPSAWRPLRPLVVKSESPEQVMLEIGGQDEHRDLATLTAMLVPGIRLQVADVLYSLAWLHVKAPLAERVAIHCPSQAETYVVEASDWSNIWVYGLDILLTGWISRLEFRQRARLVPEGSRVFQYNKTRAKNLAVPVSELKPLSRLLERAKDWAAGPTPGSSKRAFSGT
jgi:hypothetical protein